MVLRRVAGVTALAVDRIYVIERLPHHLYPPEFKEGFVLRHMVTM